MKERENKRQKELSSVAKPENKQTYKNWMLFASSADGAVHKTDTVLTVLLLACPIAEA